MKIVEPRQNNKKRHAWRVFKSKKIYYVIPVVLIVCFCGYYFFISNPQDLKYETQDSSLMLVEEFVDNEEPAVIGDEIYQSLWYSLVITDAQIPKIAPDIQNDTEFTRIVTSLSESSGYRLQRIYSGDSLSEFRGVPLDITLVEPLQKLIQSASRAGLQLSISSGYRSLEDQEDIFMSRYRHNLTSGKTSEESILAVLEGAAAPGYSKHHSAFTVDMTCSGLGAKNFIGTACDKWLSANDYEQAKLHGFIPSYPTNVDVQGPAPEPWEYNFVGADIIEELGI